MTKHDCKGCGECEDNVVDFDVSTQGKDLPFDPEEVIQEGTPKVLEMINKNRQAGIELLKKKIEVFDNREPLLGRSINEDEIRDIESAIRGALTVIDAHNALTDMILSDLINGLRQQEQLMQNHWRASAHLQVLIELLKSKGVFTEEERKEAWEKAIAEAQEAKDQGSDI